MAGWLGRWAKRNPESWLAELIEAPWTQAGVEARAKERAESTPPEPVYWKEMLPPMNRLEHADPTVCDMAALIDEAILSVGGYDSAWESQQVLDRIEAALPTVPQELEGVMWRSDFQGQLAQIQRVMKAARGSNEDRHYGPGMNIDGDR
jgi:hypothetical protein